MFADLNSKTHNISLTNNIITLANNRGTLGNLYMAVHCQSLYDMDEDFDMNILISNVSSIQTAKRIASPGIVIKYNIWLKNANPDRTFLNPWSFGSSSVLFKRDNPYLDGPDCCSYWRMLPSTQLFIGTRSWTKRVYIAIQNGHFKGSCVIIRDSKLSIEHLWFRFEINNIILSESKCPTALSLINIETNNYLRLSNLIIINSHSNILLVNIPNRSTSKLILTGNTYFLSNQGSISLLSCYIEFKGFVLISGNTAQK